MTTFRRRGLLAATAALMFVVAGAVPASAATSDTYLSFWTVTSSCAKLVNQLDNTASPCGDYPTTSTSLYTAEAYASADSVGDYTVNGNANTMDPLVSTSIWSQAEVGATVTTPATAKSLTFITTWTVSLSGMSLSPASSQLHNFIQHSAGAFAGPADAATGQCSDGSPLRSAGRSGDSSTGGPGTYTAKVVFTCAGASGTLGTNWQAGLSVQYLAGVQLGEAGYTLLGQLISVVVTAS